MTSLIRTVHPALVLAALHAAGFDAWEVRPSPRLHGGCTDPGHCPQHPLTHTGRDGVTRPVYGVETNASGRQARRVITVAWAAALAPYRPEYPCCRCGGEAIDSGHEVCSRCLDEVEGFHGHDPY